MRLELNSIQNVDTYVTYYLEIKYYQYRKDKF